MELRQKEEPKRLANEALLEIKKVGICGTDLHAYAGNQAFFNYPRILGHELAAEIVEIDPHPDLKAGDKVVVMPYVSCGACIACRNGKTNCCTDLQVLGVHTDGGLQERITLKTELLLPGHELSYEEMAIVEPLAIGAHALGRASLQPDEYIAVIGCGPIGLGIMKLAQIAGVKVIALDMNNQRLDYASRSLGIDYTVNVSDNALKKVLEITSGELATAVFDATGNTGAIETGHQYMSHGGRYVLVGLSKDTLGFSHPAIHAKETSLLCSRNATKEDFYHVISVLSRKLFPAASFITHMVPHHQMISHFEQWLKPETGVIKAMVEFE